MKEYLGVKIVFSYRPWDRVRDLMCSHRALGSLASSIEGLFYLWKGVVGADGTVATPGDLQILLM